MKNKIRIENYYAEREPSFVAQLFEYNLDDTVLLADALLDRDGEFSLTYSPKGSGILGLSITSRFGPPATSGSITLGGFVTVITGYEAQQVTVTICNEGDDKYRFGFNGQEKTNEIAGIGNHNTAEFWDYDTRLVRRWNKDPKPVFGISDYSTFRNNPILYVDIRGDIVSFAGNADPNDKRSYEEGEAIWNSMVNYLQANGMGKYVNSLIKSTTIFEVKFLSGMGSPCFINNIDKYGDVIPGQIPTLYINPNLALITTNNYRMSPIEITSHEIGHAYYFNENPCESWINSKTPDKQYHTKGEKILIEGIEQEGGRKLGLLMGGTTRYDHNPSKETLHVECWTAGDCEDVNVITGLSAKENRKADRRSDAGGNGKAALRESMNLETGDGKVRCDFNGGSMTTTPVSSPAK